MVTPAAASLRAADLVHRAARILAFGQGAPDGWCPVEDLAALVGAGGQGAPPQAPADEVARQRWVRRLGDLLRERPPLRLHLDGDPGYPPNLRAVRGRPALLFADGALQASDTRALAVVGSREPPEHAADQSAEIAAGLVARGYTIVSGLARGIDSAGHLGALDAGGRTIAVVGTGIDQVYPAESRGLVDRIRHAGAVVSQFPPGQGPSKTSFPARNAVIAGLSLGSVVVAAGAQSGTRIEIDATLAQGRPVFLWERFLDGQPWAAELARERLVHTVRSVSEVDEIVKAIQAA